ncbi:hypothetical protein [Acinetobacter nosocomialis]|uniref:hypothetical protein n=1 Tax=Acinetobacter nosocomialis TaxID=106654 RepID=UPI0029D76C90|nr:hypothetical protein [Acinetobacter nosocomialis]MDX7882055.1 hypothetical protein [Acinetobacter nosocomialis]
MYKDFIINQIESSIKNMEDALSLDSKFNQQRQLNETMHYAKGLVTGLGLANVIDLNEYKKYIEDISDQHSALLEKIASNILGKV